MGGYYTDITECARSKFNFEFVDYLVVRVKELRPETKLIILAEGIMWYPDEYSWVFHKDRVKEFGVTGDWLWRSRRTRRKI